MSMNEKHISIDRGQYDLQTAELCDLRAKVAEVYAGDEVFGFICKFSWWDICRSNSGNTHRIVVAVRHDSGEYVRVYGRSGESVHSVVGRLREKVDALEAEINNAANAAEGE